MKKHLLLLVMMLLPMIAYADKSGTCGDNVTWTFVESTGTLTIKGSGAIYRYAQVSSVPWYEDREKITTLVIGNGVTTIGRWAFSRCSSMTSVTIPNSVTKIEEDAFSHCSSLTSVTIGNSVTSIGSYAFHDCSNLTSVTIPNSVTSIGVYAFYKCYKLSNINIPVIDYAAFCYNQIVKLVYDKIGAGRIICLIDAEGKEIHEYVIPDGMMSIGDNAFYYCSGLTSITIPNSVTSIGNNAFQYCSGLTSVTIGSGVTSIGNNAFQYCSGLKKVIVKDIAAWCGIKFNGYDSNPLYYAKHIYSDEDTEITNLIIPNSVTSIGDYAFVECYGLTSVTIPNSVTSIGNFAFYNCSGLTSVTIPNSVTSIGHYAFYNCSGLTSITIPNSVMRIEEGAFRNCSGLTSVTIPNSVTSIGNYAFDGVDISTVISLIENPFTITGKTSYYRTFSPNTFNNATLYVPVGTKEKYQATDGWKEFQNIVEGTPTGIKVIENIQNKNATVYDLNGVRLPAPKKGINIINGQKVVVK